MSLPTPRLVAAVRAGGVTPKFPARALTWETKGSETVTQTLEQEEQHEDAGAPVAPQTVPYEENAGDDANGPEESGDEPAAGKPSGPQSDREVKALGKKLDAERERHAKKLGDILGDASTDTLPCPLCFEALMGFVLPGDAASLPEDQRVAALAFLGQEAPGHLREAEGVVMCDRCDGFGELAYPTRNPHMKNQICPKCSSNGYVPVQQQAATVTNLPHVVTQADAQANGVVGPCPLCLAPNSAGRPHFCNPVGQGVT